MKPWGTPRVFVTFADLQFSTETIWNVLYKKNESAQYRPYQNHDISISTRESHVTLLLPKGLHSKITKIYHSIRGITLFTKTKLWKCK